MGWGPLFLIGVLLVPLGGGTIVRGQTPSRERQDWPHNTPGSRKIYWSLYAQIRYTGLEGAGDLYALRRLKLVIGGQVSERMRYYVQGIFKEGNKSHTDGRAYLQEAWLEFTPGKHARIRLGQFKPPFGMERFTSDAKLYTIDRSQATDHLIPNGGLGRSFARDRGLQIAGRAIDGRLAYAWGVFDGRGANHRFHGIGPLIAVRITYDIIRRRPLAGRPLTVHLGGALATRRARDVDFHGCCPDRQGLALRHFRGRDTRLGLEWAGDWGGTSLRAEYLQAHLDFRHPAQRDFTANGFYIQGAQFLSRKLQLVVRFEQFDPNRLVVNQRDIRWTTVGMNYYIRSDRVKLMADYVFRRERVVAAHNDAFVIQLQFFLH